MLNYVTLTTRQRGKTAAIPEGFLEEVVVAGGLAVGQQGGPFNQTREEAVWWSHPNISLSQLAPSVHPTFTSHPLSARLCAPAVSVLRHMDQADPVLNDQC